MLAGSDKPTATSIPTLTQECLDKFRVILSQNNEQFELHDRFSDLLGRFRVWTANVSAHTVGCRSLQYRLRDSSELSEGVVLYLQQLKVELDRGSPSPHL